MLTKRTAENGRIYVPLAELMQWEKNPRNHTQEGLMRLVRQIARLGQFKDVIVSPEGSLIGGNKRLLALNHVNTNVVKITDANDKERDIDRRGQFNEIRITEISFIKEELTPEQVAAGQESRWRAVIDGVEQKDVNGNPEWFGSPEQIMIEYGLADNDEIGEWDKRALRVLLQPHAKLMPQKTFGLKMGPSVDMNAFRVGQREKAPHQKTEVECPDCHKKFIPA
jgi:ParB-like nuclease family protein